MVVDGGFRTEKPSTEGDAKVLKVWVGLNVELSFTKKVSLEPQLGRTLGLYYLCSRSSLSRMRNMHMGK